MLKDVTCMVINLPERTDRLDKFKSVFNTYFKSNELIVIQAEKHTKAQQGCNISHKKAICKAIELGLENVLIFEDDFEFITTKSFDYVNEASKNLPNDFDIALFGWYYLPNKLKVNEYWNKVGDFCALHCYLVNKKAYDKILNLPTNHHIDRLIGKEIYGIKKYATNLLATKQANNFSNIQNRQTDYDKLLQKFKQI